MTEVLLGWLVYSLGAYWSHRAWHIMIRRGCHNPLSNGERMHHIAYDRPDRKIDPHKAMILPPGGMIALLIAIIGLPIGSFFTLSALTCFAIDEQVHLRSHTYLRKTFFTRMHDIHHAKHHKNYAFPTGIIWDWLFRTLETGK